MVEQLELVQKLVEKGCKVYGSSKCGFCKKQIAVFSDEKAKKFFLEKVYKNVQDMKEKPKVNGYPTLVCGDKKYSGFKTLEQLEEFIKEGSFPEPVKRDSTCEQELAQLENKVKQRRFDFWIYADNTKIIPGKEMYKIIFCKIKSTKKYQVYNEFNKELNKDRIITNLTLTQLNNQLSNLLGPNWIPTGYMEYERCRDKKLRSFAFDLYKSELKNDQLILDVKLSNLNGNPKNLTKLNKPENGKYVACNIDKTPLLGIRLLQAPNNNCKNVKKGKCNSYGWCVNKTSGTAQTCYSTPSGQQCATGTQNLSNNGRGCNAWYYPACPGSIKTPACTGCRRYIKTSKGNANVATTGGRTNLTSCLQMGKIKSYVAPEKFREVCNKGFYKSSLCSKKVNCKYTGSYACKTST